MAMPAQILEAMSYITTNCHDFITGWKRAPKHYRPLEKSEYDAARYRARKAHRRGGLKRLDCGRNAMGHAVNLKENVL